MTVVESEGIQLETPFAESEQAPVTGEQGVGHEQVLGFLPWTESLSPFTESLAADPEGGWGGEAGELLASTFESLRDEQFDEALAGLVAETAEAADGRLTGEQPQQLVGEHVQLAEAHLAPLGAEAERCLQRFADQLAPLDVQGLAPDQLDEVLGRAVQEAATDVRGVTPAGEEFIGGLIKKGVRLVKSVAGAAGKVIGSLPVLGPILNKLKGLVQPLLRRVLAMAIGKLPPALHAPARALAKRLGVGESEAETEELLELEDELESAGEDLVRSPVAVLDPLSLAESLDATLAEAVLGGETLEQGESFGHGEHRDAVAEAGSQLEQLAEARGALIGRLQSAGEGEDLTPAMEQFIPAILPALRLGVRLVGRPKVVGFLAGFLAKLIGRWVGPQLSGPLSNAIVDVGLRVVGLEQGQPGQLEQEAAPTMLAATVEDTVRRLSEQPEAMLEDEQLLRLAVGEAFEAAVAANFPSQLVRPDLQVAPTLGGSFVTLHARTPHAYKKFSRVPEVTITAPVAASITSFRGVRLDASLRALGLTLPLRARVHVFEAAAGTTLPRLAALERIGGPEHPRGAYGRLHPLTPQAAGMLLREPRLGVEVPGRFLESRHRIAVGQRFFHLEPVDQRVAPPVPAATGTASTIARTALTAVTTPGAGTVAGSLSRVVGSGAVCAPSTPSETRLHLSLRTGEARLAMYLSEADCQRLAATLQAAPGNPTPLLRALVRAAFAASRRVGRTDGSVRVREAEQEWEGATLGEEELRTRPRAVVRRRGLPLALRASVRRQVRGLAARALAGWVRTGVGEFLRATQDPACGVTVTVTMRGVVARGPVGAVGRTGSPGISVDGGTVVGVVPGRALP